MRHPGILSPLGATDEGLIVGEWYPSLSLSELIRRLCQIDVEMPPATSVWIVREIARTLVDVAAQLEPKGPTMVHGALELGRVFVDLDGKIRVADIGLSPLLGDPTCDVLGCGLILDGLLEARGDAAPPPAITAMSGWGIAQVPFETLSAFEAALETAFYRDMGGDEERHGAPGLATLVGSVALELSPPGIAGPEAPAADLPSVELEELGALVVPRSLSHADRPTGFVSVALPIPELVNDDPADDVPQVDTFIDSSPPSTMMEPSVPGLGPGTAFYRPGLLWFVAGFAIGLVLLKLFDWL